MRGDANLTVRLALEDGAVDEGVAAARGRQEVGLGRGLGGLLETEAIVGGEGGVVDSLMTHCST